MAHGNGHAVLADAKHHAVPRTKRRNLVIFVAGRLAMIEIDSPWVNDGSTLGCVLEYAP
jgi:hypothetical protein